MLGGNEVQTFRTSLNTLGDGFVEALDSNTLVGITCVIHPFSDSLLHDVGTGDGIVQNGGSPPATGCARPPLWGVRSRARLMHDGETLTRNEAILRHAGQATSVINGYRNLSANQKNQLVAFLNSL